MARIVRLTRLHQAICTMSGPITAARLAEATGVSLRSIYRDIGTLRAMGIRIEGERGYGYRLLEDDALPPNKLENSEIGVNALDVQSPQQIDVSRVERGNATIENSSEPQLPRVTSFEEMVSPGGESFSIAIDKEEFFRVLSSYCAQRKVHVFSFDDVYEQFAEELSAPIFAYWEHVHSLRRKSLQNHLKAMGRVTNQLSTYLEADKEGIHHFQHIFAYSLVAKGLKDFHADNDTELNIDIGVADQVVHLLQHAVMSALQRVKDSASKKGRKRLAFYDAFALVMTRLAEHLGVPVTTGGDRSEDPSRTPFTELAYTFEKLLPDGAESPSLIACAERLKTALRRRTKSHSSRA